MVLKVFAVSVMDIVDIVFIGIQSLYQNPIFPCIAGRSTTSEELEEMIETGNPAIFTQGVIIIAVILC